MSSRLLIFFFLMFSGSHAMSQAPCGTAIPSKVWLENFALKVQENKNRTDRITDDNYVIPIIVHVIHNGEDIGENANISYAQIESQIGILNADFSGKNADTILIPADFLSIKSGNTGIQFCLAKYDPQGRLLAEPGVERIDRRTMGWRNPESIIFPGNFEDYFDNTIKPGSIWPPDQYLNIWLSGTRDGFDMKGFARYPAMSGLGGFSTAGTIETWSTSGVWVHNKVWGNTGTAEFPLNKGRIPTHEIGHYLGLLHPFDNHDDPNSCANHTGDNCNSTGDYCCDTPPQTQMSTAGGEACIQTNSCRVPLNGEDQPDMTMNYMDYSADRCRFMFTKDQARRMRTAMENAPLRRFANALALCHGPCGDLTVMPPWISNTFVEAGSNVVINFALDNIGFGSAGANYVNIHLSTDNILTSGSNGDIYLDQYFVNQILAPLSQTINLNKEITIPSNLTPGTYYIFLAADGTGAVSECDESNNFATVTIIVGASAPPPAPILYRYWYDNNFAAAVSAGAGSEDVMLSLNTNHLPNGYHELNFQARAVIGLWGPVVTTAFLRVPLYSNQNTRHRYWFDDAFSSAVTFISSDSIINLSLNVANWSQGFHTLRFQTFDKSGHWSPIITNYFLRTTSANGMVRQRYWFDQNFAAAVVNSLSDETVTLPIDANTLSSGYHQLNFQAQDAKSSWSPVVSNFFLRINEQNSMPQHRYWTDDNFEIAVVVNGSDTLIDLSADVSGLSPGMHRFHFQAKDESGNWSSIVTSHFLKTDAAVNNIQRYRYWFDNNFDDAVTITSTGELMDMSTDVAGLQAGTHHLHFQSQDDKGNWSSVITSQFMKDCSLTATVSASGPLSFCTGGSVTLTASAGMSAYIWSNGATTPSIDVVSAGSYTVTVQNAAGCSATSTPVTVLILPAPAIPVVTPDGTTAICIGQTVTYSVTNPCAGCSYTWSNGQTGNSITTGIANSYAVSAQNGCGTVAGNTVLLELKTPVSITAQPSNVTAVPPAPASFTVAAGGTDLGYEWQRWDGAAWQLLTNTGPYSGTATATLSIGATSAAMNGSRYRCVVFNSCNSIASGEVQLNSSCAAPDPPAITSSTGSFAACFGGSMTLTATVAGCTGCSFTWSDGTTGPVLILNNLTTAASYIVTAATVCGTSQSTQAISVTPTPPAPTGIATSQGDICAGGSVNLTALGTLGAGAQWKWYTGSCAGAPVHTGAVFSASPSTTTTYYLRAENGSCVSSCQFATITVSQPPVAPVITAAGSTSFCQGGNVVLSVSNPCAGCTYTWSDGQTGTSITVSASGDYYVSSQSSCATLQSNHINVLVTPPPLTPVITANPSSGVVCSPGSVMLSVSNAPSCINCSYTWSNGLQGALANINASGSFSVSASNGCGTAISSAQPVTINNPPVITVSGNPDPVCQSSALTLTASGASAYTWTGPNLNSVTGASVTATPTTPGTAIYTVSGMQNSCTAHQTISVTVTPTGSGACFFTTLQGVDGLQAFEVIPNPSSGIFFVKLKLTGLRQVSFRVLDVLGREVYASGVFRYLDEVRKEIEIRNVSSGVYFLETSIGKQVVTSKIVVVR